MTFSVIEDFIAPLRSGDNLCLMPVPRLELVDRIDRIDDRHIYPAESVNLDELNVVEWPDTAFESAVTRGAGELAWFQSAATCVSRSDFANSTLIGFTQDTDWDSLLSGDHNQHRDLIRELGWRAERCLDIVRYQFCRLDLPETLPGRAGNVAGTKFSAALLYRLHDHEAHVIGGEVLSHTVTAGLGLEIGVPPNTIEIAAGEVGSIARQALAMLSEAMEANSDTAKFIRCISLFEFLACPSEYLGMKKAKKEIAAHVATSEAGYQHVLDDFEQLTNKVGIRARLVHMGMRFEQVVGARSERDAIFRRLQGYASKVIGDLIGMAAAPWAAVPDYRRARRSQLVGRE